MYKKIVIAHRGASGYLPEHTAEAKVLAHSFNVDYIEQDVVLSKDNIPVILHDIYLDDVSDVATKFPQSARADKRFYVIDFTFAQLKTLNIFERFSPITKKAIYPNRFPNKLGDFKISSLQEEIELIVGLNKSRKLDVGLYVELKQVNFHKSQNKDITQIVLNILDSYRYTKKEDNFYIQCFDFDELKRIRNDFKSTAKLILLLEKPHNNPNTQDAPNTNYQYLMSPKGLTEASQYINGIGPHYNLTFLNQNNTLQPTPLVDLAHQLGLTIHIYTAKKEEFPDCFTTLEEFLKFLYFELNVDGVFCDFPDIAMKILKS